MAVLGIGGKLLLKRAAPEPFLISDSALDAGNNLYTASEPGYWNGDRVTVNCLPTATGPFPPKVDGYANYYGGNWFLGPNRTQISSNSDRFYKTSTEQYPDGDRFVVTQAGDQLITQSGDDFFASTIAGDGSQFYSREGDTSGGNVIPFCFPEDYYIHIDALGYLSFYFDRCAALAGSLTNRINLFPVGGTTAVAPYGTLDYSNAVWGCLSSLGEYRFSDAQDTVTLISICADAPAYQLPEGNLNTETFSYNNANIVTRGAGRQAAPFWQQLCDIAQWSLELNAPSVETTSVSEKFGNAVKSLVTGGGSAEFLIDRKCYTDEKDNGLGLMQLLMMTEKGCEATAQFWMVDRVGSSGVNNGSIQGGLYYEANILVTASAVNLRPAEIVAGTVQFVTTEDIKLLITSEV